MDGAGEFAPWMAADGRASAAALVERALAEEDLAGAALPPDAQRRRTRWYRRARHLADHLDRAGVAVPPQLLTRYRMPASRRRGMNGKYQMRCLNNLRELARFAALFPELMTAQEARRFRDLSAGPCGTYEVIRHYGHEVELTDYFSEADRRRGAAYRAIHAELGCEAAHFDGSVLPYEAPAEPYDHVLCYQAIDAYAPSGQWAERIDAMLALATRSVALIFNPPAAREGISRGSGALSALVDRVVEELETPVRPRKARCPDTGLPALVLSHEG